MEKGQTLGNIHKINKIHRNSLRFNQCKIINTTEKSESQNTAETTVTRLCDAAAFAPTVQTSETFCAFETITEPMTAENNDRSVTEMRS